MYAKILEILLYFLYFFIFPATIHSKNPCPASSCPADSFLEIKYPFKQENDRRPKHCPDHIDLKCNDKGKPVINIPASGDFYVSGIDYYSNEIWLTDPQDCLVGRLMMNFSLYPLEAMYYETYTLFMCPQEVAFLYDEIACLSNSSANSTIVQPQSRAEYMEKEYGCKPISSFLVPVQATDRYAFQFNLLQLTWNASSCKACEKIGDGSRSKWPKFFSSPLFIPSAAVLVTLFIIASFLRLMKLLAARRNTNPPADNHTTDSTTTAPPGTTTDTPAAPSETANQIDQNSKANPCTEIIVLNENEGTSLPNGVNTCSVCLEDYNGKDVIKYLPKCGHYFHAECIDQWLEKNTTCPVCRNHISIF